MDKPKEKKITTTKLIVALMFVITFILLSLIIYVSINLTNLIISVVGKEQNITSISPMVTFLSTLITQLVVAFTSCVLVLGYIIKGYLKKSFSENAPYGVIKFLRGIIDIEDEKGRKILEKDESKNLVNSVKSKYSNATLKATDEVLLIDIDSQAK